MILLTLKHLPDKISVNYIMDETEVKSIICTGNNTPSNQLCEAVYQSIC
jgi:hypothetical protein